ncbi:hypothetical protein D3C75_1116910 [compost metagenome]
MHRFQFRSPDAGENTFNRRTLGGYILNLHIKAELQTAAGIAARGFQYFITQIFHRREEHNLRRYFESSAQFERQREFPGHQRQIEQVGAVRDDKDSIQIVIIVQLVLKGNFNIVKNSRMEQGRTFSAFLFIVS